MGSTAGADHDCHRSGQTQGARTRDDQHRDRVHQRMRQARLRSEPEPGEKGDDGDRYNRGHEPGSHPIGKALNGSAAALCLTN